MSKERPRLIPSHGMKVPALANASGRLTAYPSGYQGESFSQSGPYTSRGIQPKPRHMPNDLSKSVEERINSEMFDQSRRMPGSASVSNHPSSTHPLDLHQQRERPHRELGIEQSNPSLRSIPLDPSSVPSRPKKARYHEAARMTTGVPPWSQPLHINTNNMDGNKMKQMEPLGHLGGYHPETEAISPTLPTESHDSKSDIVHSINEVDRELNLIENQIQQLQKKELELEAEAAKPAQSLPEEDSTESKPLSIAQIIYKENRRHAHKSHDLLSKLKYTDPAADLPLFHQPSDTDVYHENARKFSTFKSVLQAYLKRKAEERSQTEAYWSENYERLVMSWLKKVDAKTLKKNIKDIKTREYYEKVFPEIKKQREDKERITSRVGARGVSSGYARTEAEFEQIVDGITEQEEEEKKMRAYAIIPPMLNQTQRKLKFINRNGLIEEPMSEYKMRKQTTSWSVEEKEIFKEKYLERPKQFGQISEILEKKTLNDCVLYYYMSKKSENYKQLLKKQVKRPPRRLHIKPNMRTSNEGHGVPTSEGTSCGTTNCDPNDQDVINVTRLASEDSKPNCCAVCGKKLESYTLSQALTRNTCTQFGLNIEDFQATWRVCSACAKLRRRKTKICPIPSCSSPHRRIRHLPVHWQQIPPPIKAKIMSELQMEEEVKRCCSACYDKVADILLDGDNDVDETSTGGGYAAKWTAEDITSYKNGIRQHGKEWQAVAALVQSKSQNQCRMYFYRNKKKLGLDIIYNEFRKQKASEGLDIEPSDDSADEDDDNVEDNDLSSDNENTGHTDSSLNTVIDKVEAAPSPFKKEELIEPKPEKIVRGSPTMAMVNGDMISGQDTSALKSELSGPLRASVKQEKMDHDSSATASADEEHSVDNHFLEDQVSNEAPLHPLLKAMKFVKQEPGLMHNPDGMFPPVNSVFSGMPPSLSHTSKNQSRSVADLINLAIEDALSGGNPTNDVITSANQRQSVINHKNSPGIVTSSKTSQHLDMRMERNAQSMANSVPVSHTLQHIATTDDPTSRRTAQAPYEGDPRAYVQASKEKQQLGQQRFQMPGTIDGMQGRAPPPAHSHHLNHSLDKRSSDRKSPATQFAMYDKTNSSDNCMSLHGRQTIGQPPPLISSGHHQHSLSHMAQHIKKEASHAGGSILKGTSASHSQQPTRFDGGSISHGTPRNQTESKPLSQTNRGEEKSSRSPRSQPSMHSPAVPSPVPAPVPGAISHMDKFIEQQQHQQLMYLHMQRALRPGQLTPNFSQLAASFPPAFESYQTKSVLQNDFLTAKQMTNNSVNVPVNAAAYSSALDKDKGGQMSPHPRDPLLAAKAAGVQSGIIDPQMMMLMNSTRLMAPRIAEHPRLPIVPMATPTATKEEARSWTLVNKTSQPNRPTSEAPIGQKQVIIPKTVEMLQRPPENSRRSASPHAKRDGKTRYEKELEEMKYKTERSQQDKSGYSHKPQLAPNYNKSVMSSMKQDELLREKSTEGRERSALDYRDQLSSQFSRSSYVSNEDSHHSGQPGGDKTSDTADQASSYADALHCKKLRQVSQVIRKEQLPKDASSLFSSSFEKDSHMQRPFLMGGTAANMINDIITKQINKETTNEQNRQLAAAASHQHTSVIVPPKKQRSIQHSRSDTDISSYSPAGRLSGSVAETSSTNSLPPSSASNTCRSSGQITLADRINEIITNDYNSIRASENSEVYSSVANQKSERPASNPTTHPTYKVKDVEPISPPSSSGSQSKTSKYGDNQNNAGKLGIPGSKKNAGIRSLLVADNCNSVDSNKPVEVLSSAPPAGMSLMEVLKNNLDEAIRHDVDLNNANGQAKPPLYGTSQQPYSTERLCDASAQRDSISKKRNLEAMLAPTGKRAAVSPCRDRSPEEIEMYPANTSSSPALLPSSGPLYRPPVSNPYSNASIYSRPLTPSHYQQPQMGSGLPDSSPFNTPNSPSKTSPINPNAATSKPGSAHLNTDHVLSGYSNLPIASHTYYQQRNSIPSSRYPSHVSTGRTISTDELVIDESSNSGTDSKQGGTSNSPARGAMRSPGVTTCNRMSPIGGYHNNTAQGSNRVSPIAGASAASRTSPLTSMQACVRKSPISVPNSSNRMSPGVYGGAQANSSRPSSRQSPALSNRQSPIASGHSPLDGMVKSPLTFVESSASRGIHLNTDICKFSSVNENSVPHALAPKPLDSTRSINSLGMPHSRPLLSERYETLSDDDR